MIAACAAILCAPALVQGEPPAAVDERAQRRLTPEVLVVREASPAVVYIVATGYAQTFFGLQQQQAAGTGVMVDADGFLVTNFHVVANYANSRNYTNVSGTLQVQFDSSVDAKTYQAQLVSWVTQEDLALLKITGERKFPTVKLGISSDLMIGERVIAIGNPFQQKLSVSAGIISGLHRQLDVDGSDLRFNDLIQTDASINHGNSGGPLLNINGEMIGLNTVVRENAENMGYAIPVDRVRDVLLNELFAPKWERAWLGFELEPEPSLRVKLVRAGSPAGTAGILPGDSIVAIDDVVLAGLPATEEGGARKTPRAEYNNRRLTLLPGVPVKLVLRRPAGETTVTLEGWTKVDGILYDRLGLTAEPVSVLPGTLLRIEQIEPGGPAASIGLAVGDLVDAVRRENSQRGFRLTQSVELARLAVELPAQAVLEIDILRDENQDLRLERSELFKGRLTLR